MLSHLRASFPTARPPATAQMEPTVLATSVRNSSAPGTSIPFK